jgi:gliding motility-associated-like protein
MIDCYNLTGPYNINFQVDPPNTGKITVNSILVPSYPWTGVYYGNIETILKAVATATNYTFDYWELVDPVIPNTITDSVTTTFTGSQTVIAHFITSTPPIIVTGIETNSPCYGENIGSIDLTVTGGYTSSGGYNYIWSNGEITQDIYSLGPGNYAVTVTDDSIGVSVTSFVITQPLQIALTTSPDLQICVGATANINAYPTGDSPPYYYQWSNGNTSSGFSVSPQSDILYVVTVTGSNGCLGISDSVYIKVNSGVDLNIFASKNNICPNETVQLTLSMNNGGGPPYMIYNSVGNIVIPPISVTPISSGFQYLYVQDGCGSIAHDSVFITVNPNPNPSFLSDINEGCEPLTVSFNPISSIAGQTYSWNFGDYSNSSISYNMNPVHKFSTDGIFDVSLTVTSSFGCDSTKVFNQMINVFKAPEARFIANPNSVSIVKPQVIFSNLSEFALTYLWSFGDGDSSSIKNPMHWYQMLGEYNVKLIAVSDKGCKDTVYSSILIRDEYTFYTPNAITPDGDGSNDVFYILGNEISTKEFHLYIIDRWGGVIFETDKYDKDQPAKYGWDGSLKGGSIVSIGSYTWFVKYYDGDGIQHDKSGVVNVIR